MGRLPGDAAAFLLVFLLGVAAPLPSSAGEEPKDISYGDPLEPLNRIVFAVNEMLDTIVLRPA
ncbi:MAG: VacJ family lipoprotein, partial [Alphaproteobacteria bacterium]|nr:VacJ family lipoprotein [Alphaproteobacteria bacterium]